MRRRIICRVEEFSGISQIFCICLRLHCSPPAWFRTFVCSSCEHKKLFFRETLWEYEERKALAECCGSLVAFPIFSCINLMTTSNLVWTFFLIIEFFFLTLSVEELHVVPLVRNCPYLHVVYVDIHMQQSVSTICFLHIRASACVRVPLSLLESRESVTSRKILCKFQEIRRNSVFVFACVDWRVLVPHIWGTSCLCLEHHCDAR